MILGEPGLPPSDAADGARDLVLLSYSHTDAEWVQRLEVLLKPVVRARRFGFHHGRGVAGADCAWVCRWHRCWWVTVCGSRWQNQAVEACASTSSVNSSEGFFQL